MILWLVYVYDFCLNKFFFVFTALAAYGTGNQSFGLSEVWLNLAETQGANVNGKSYGSKLLAYDTAEGTFSLCDRDSGGALITKGNLTIFVTSKQACKPSLKSWLDFENSSKSFRVPQNVSKQFHEFEVESIFDARLTGLFRNSLHQI